MGSEDFGPDERLPYWAEVWPAGLVLAAWLGENRDRVRGRACLDVGCGLGLTAMVASWLGARVVALDYERPALGLARTNALANRVPQPLWVQMDWREPGFRPGSFPLILCADLFYERRFFGPLLGLFKTALAPGGVVLAAEPRRGLGEQASQAFAAQGLDVERLSEQKAFCGGQGATVTLWRLVLNQ
ncbi:MAG: methyltransferase domain-containing protein [Desulfovibrionaceae bacterium]|nr:methyltransferase domain-containing protein [Desulfovibrionaceae bacterium]